MPRISVELPISKSIAIREMAITVLEYSEIRDNSSANPSQNEGITHIHTGTGIESSEQLFLQKFPADWIADQPRDCRVMHSACLQWLQRTEAELVLDFIDAGTPFRFFTAIACLSPFPTRLSGNSSLVQRPIAPLVEVLRTCGAKISYLDTEGFPPLIVQGPLSQIPDTLTIDSSLSSQFASALALLFHRISPSTELHWEGPPTSRSYYQLTLTLLQRKSQSSSSQAADAQSSTTHPTPPASIPTAPNIIPRDWSASAFFYAWVANQENLEVFFPDLRQEGLQGDEAMPQLFSSLGVSTYFQDGGTLIKKSTIPNGVLTLNFSNHLDAVPAVVVALLLQERSATVVGIRNLQWKESNRLEALQQICQEIGARLIPVDVAEDRWVLNCQHVRWPDSLSLTTRHDHRLAMAFSILSTKIPHLTLDDTACVEKSFPSFWQQFNFHQKP